MKLTLDEIEQALGDVNMYYASEKLGRRATPIEAIRHFVRSQPWIYPPHTFNVERTRHAETSPEPT